MYVCVCMYVYVCVCVYLYSVRQQHNGFAKISFSFHFDPDKKVTI
jgi:hypothetical protein